MTPVDLLNLVLDNGRYEGKYVNGHPAIVQRLIEYIDEGLLDCYIEILEQDLSSVRVWSKKELSERKIILESKDSFKLSLEKQLRNAIAKENFAEAMRIKQLMKESL